MLESDDIPSTRPYLIRAFYEWCSDNGFTPQIIVQVGSNTQVPLEYAKGGEIVLNISMDATHGLQLGNEWIEFQARFGGVARQLVIPVDHVLSIFARENAQGLAFPAPRDSNQTGESETSPDAPLLAQEPDDEPPNSPPTKPVLRRIK